MNQFDFLKERIDDPLVNLLLSIAELQQALDELDAVTERLIGVAATDSS